MKNIVINIHNNSKTIATHHLDINDKKPLIIQAKPHLNYEFLDEEIAVSPNHIVSKRGGDDLGILLNNEVKDAGIVIIKDFYKYADNALIGLAENSQYYYYIPDSAEIGDYVTQLTHDKSSGLALGGEGFDQPWWIDGSKTKKRRSLKALLKSIISDDSAETATFAKENENHVKSSEHASTGKTETFTKVETKTTPSVEEKSTTTEVKTSQSVKTTETVSSEEGGFLENLDISPWLIGASAGLGALALLGSGGNSSKSSSQNTQNFLIEGNDKDNPNLNGTDKDDTIKGYAGNDTLDGKEGDDTLIGGDGFDTLIGGKGSDTLTGGNDNDTFVYKLSDLTDTKAVDTITDFTAKIDKIQLPKELFKADKVMDNLTDYIKYDKSTGELSYDSDGKGGNDAVVFATLTNHVDLTIDSDNFQII